MTSVFIIHAHTDGSRKPAHVLDNLFTYYTNCIHFYSTLMCAETKENRRNKLAQMFQVFLVTLRPSIFWRVQHSFGARRCFTLCISADLHGGMQWRNTIAIWIVDRRDISLSMISSHIFQQGWIFCHPFGNPLLAVRSIMADFFVFSHRYIN